MRYKIHISRNIQAIKRKTRGIQFSIFDKNSWDSWRIHISSFIPRLSMQCSIQRESWSELWWCERNTPKESGSMISSEKIQSIRVEKIFFIHIFYFFLSIRKYFPSTTYLRALKNILTRKRAPSIKTILAQAEVSKK